MLATILADGKRLFRVIVDTPQTIQMRDILLRTLGGLIGRRVRWLPSTRGMDFTEERIEKITALCQHYMQNGDIVIAEADHLLSLKLLVREQSIGASPRIGSRLAQLEEWLRLNSQDVVDESDSVLSLRKQMVFPVGERCPISFAPDRYNITIDILDAVHELIPQMQKEYPGLFVFYLHEKAQFPVFRMTFSPKVLSEGAECFLRRLATKLCEKHLPHLSRGVRSTDFQATALTFIMSQGKHIDDMLDLGDVKKGSALRNFLLLLHQLIGSGTLLSIFSEKRWRVDYGLHRTRTPPTGLTVPFDGKDQPTIHSEFSHPDVAIIMTCLSYYYNALTEKELQSTFRKLNASGQASAEYLKWVEGVSQLPPLLKQFRTVNTRDRKQWEEDIFPTLRFAKGAINFFLELSGKFEGARLRSHTQACRIVKGQGHN
jgi:hypothetical protein